MKKGKKEEEHGVKIIVIWGWGGGGGGGELKLFALAAVSYSLVGSGDKTSSYIASYYCPIYNILSN